MGSSTGPRAAHSSAPRSDVSPVTGGRTSPSFPAACHLRARVGRPSLRAVDQPGPVASHRLHRELREAVHLGRRDVQSRRRTDRRHLSRRRAERRLAAARRAEKDRALPPPSTHVRENVSAGPGSCAESPTTIRLYRCGLVRATSATWLPPIEKPASTYDVVSSTHEPKTFFAAPSARSILSAVSAAVRHPSADSRPPKPRGQTTNAYPSMTARHAAHARSGFSLPPWSAISTGRGSRAPSGTETKPSLSLPSRSSSCSGNPGAVDGSCRHLRLPARPRRRHRRRARARRHRGPPGSLERRVPRAREREEREGRIVEHTHGHLRELEAEAHLLLLRDDEHVLKRIEIVDHRVHRREARAGARILEGGEQPLDAPKPVRR